MFELGAASSAIIYLGGVVLIAFKAPVLFSRPGILFMAMVFPVYAFTSTLWGVDPTVTVNHATQLVFTSLLAASIGCYFRPHQLLLAMSVAFGLLIALSVANLWLLIVPAFQQRSYLQGNEYFTGIFTHKNTLGYVLCLGSLCFAYLILKLTPRWPYVILLLSVFPILLFARSTTSLVLYGFILTMPFVYMLVQQKKLRGIIAISLVCAAVLTVILLELFQLSLIDIGLELAGKGRDMSGRTSLWTLALARFSERPWLGVGYQSFWTAAQFQTDVDWVHGSIVYSISHFHNAWLEILVGLGILGAVAMAVVPVALLCVLVPRLFGNKCSPIDIAVIYLVILVVARSNVEASLSFQHQSENVALTSLLVSILLYTKSTVDTNRKAKTGQQKI